MRAAGIDAHAMFAPSVFLAARRFGQADLVCCLEHNMDTHPPAPNLNLIKTVQLSPTEPKEVDVIRGAVQVCRVCVENECVVMMHSRNWCCFV